MRAAVINDEREFEVRAVPDPEPEPDQVLVRVAACGVCGSDIHMRDAGIAFPGMIMGHEIGGTVARVGDHVTAWREGDRVAVMPYLPCGTCHGCRRGRPQVCANTAATAMGLGTRPGGLAEYVTVYPGQLFLLPAGLPAAAGALAEPLAVGFHGVDRSGITPEDTAAVLGGGSIGVMTAIGLRAKGVADLVVTEPADQRRETLAALGFQAMTPKELAATTLTPDVVFDTTGVGSVLSEATTLVRAGGTVVLMGIDEKPAQIMPLMWVVKEITVTAVLAYGETFPDAVAALGDGRVDVGVLSAERVPLEETEKTFRRLARADAPPKVLIEPGS